jgi:hypothetical protein
MPIWPKRRYAPVQGWSEAAEILDSSATCFRAVIIVSIAFIGKRRQQAHCVDEHSAANGRAGAASARRQRMLAEWTL